MRTVNAKKVIIWYFFPIIWIYGKCKEYVYGKLQAVRQKQLLQPEKTSVGIRII